MARGDDESEALVPANLRLPRVLADAIDRLVAAENAENPYKRRTRADVMRDLLAEAVLARESAAPGAKPRKGAPAAPAPSAKASRGKARKG